MNYLNIYTKAFSDKNYSSDHHVQYDWVIEILKKKYSSRDKFSIIDIGSGRGHILNLIHKNFPYAAITSVDLDNFHNLNFVDNFKKCDITSVDDRSKLLNNKYDVLINLDFLEHIEKKYIDDILTTFRDLSPYCIIAVANHSDIINGVQLHLIQENNDWWKSKLEDKFNITHYMDDGKNTIYMYELNSKG